VIGWLAALALAAVVLRLRTRLELVACAEHELRGPLTAFALALESGRRGGDLADALEAELARACAALADLSEARRGRRAGAARRRLDLERLARSAAAAWGARVDWRAGRALVVSDEGRVAQALGNLLANAAEHGGGEVVLRAEPAAHGLRLVVANRDRAPDAGSAMPDRGRGLRIASKAARDAGGKLSVERRDGEFAATLELAGAQ
jgi:signal transduction histidine kinase